MVNGSIYHPNPLSVPHTLGDLKKSGGHPQTPARGIALWTPQFYLAIVIRTGTTPVPPVLPRKDTSFRNRMCRGMPWLALMFWSTPCYPPVFLSLPDLIGQSSVIFCHCESFQGRTKQSLLILVPHRLGLLRRSYLLAMTLDFPLDSGFRRNDISKNTVTSLGADLGVFRANTQVRSYLNLSS